MTNCVSKSSHSSQHSLVDRRSNGGVVDRNLRVIETHPDRNLDIHGVDKHQISFIPLVTTGGVTTTIKEEVIEIMHQCAYHVKNKPMHYSPQIEHYKNIVDDLSIKVCGRQHIATLDKYKIHMSIRGHCLTSHCVLTTINNGVLFLTS